MGGGGGGAGTGSGGMRVALRKATKPAAMGTQPWVIQRKGKWTSQTFRGYVRSTMEYPLEVSMVLVGRKGAPSRIAGAKNESGWG